MKNLILMMFTTSMLALVGCKKESAVPFSPCGTKEQCAALPDDELYYLANGGHTTGSGLYVGSCWIESHTDWASGNLYQRIVTGRFGTDPNFYPDATMLKLPENKAKILANLRAALLQGHCGF